MDRRNRTAKWEKQTMCCRRNVYGRTALAVLGVMSLVVLLGARPISRRNSRPTAMPPW